MRYLAYAIKLLARNPRRTLTYLFGLILAVGLFSAIMFFVDASSRKMTQAAVQAVTVDMQVNSTLAQPNLAPVLNEVGKNPLVSAAAAIMDTPFSGAVNSSQAKSVQSGKLFILSPDYISKLQTLRVESGAFNAQDVLVSRELFAALGLKIGDVLTLNFSQLNQPFQAKVSGVIDTLQAPYLFASTDPAHGGEFSPVPYTVFISPELWQSSLASALVNASPSTPSGNGGGSAAPVIDGEVDLKFHHAALPSDPVKALKFADAQRRHLESLFPGEIRITNNLGDTLKKAQSDAIWAKLLFLFLGIPGVILAAYLSRFASSLGAEDQRKEISLLRTRGATPKQILIAMGFASLFIAIIGTALGIIAGVASIRVLFGAGLWHDINLHNFVLSASYAGLGGLVLAAAVTYMPIRQTLQKEIASEKQTGTRTMRKPLWNRAYLDIVSLAIAGLLLTVNTKGGGLDVAGGEAKALSFGFIIFLAPSFLWLGLTLLLTRIMGGGIQRVGSVIKAVLTFFFGDIGNYTARKLIRRSVEIGAAVIIISLAISFGTSLAIFTRTYQAQKIIDARYSLGADIQVTPAASSLPSRNLSADLNHINGVVASTGVKVDSAYVGNTVQKLYGVDAGTLAAASFFPDSYFKDTAAGVALSQMSMVPNGVLVSVQLADSYGINVGDPLLLRVLNKQTNQYVQLTGKVIGLVNRFPSSQDDAFVVANQQFVAAATNDSSITYFFARASGSPSSVAGNITNNFDKGIPLSVQNIDETVAKASSSLASVNISGLGNIESFYAIIISSLGLGIFLMSMVYRYGREYGTMRALGATRRQTRNAMWAESLTISTLALIIGISTGFLMSNIFIILLKALFTIPPTGITIPWTDLLSLYGLTIAGMVAGTLWVNRRLNKLEVDIVLREL